MISRKERLVEMLEVRDRVCGILEERLNIKFSVWFNDLYKVKDGEVRRLKGTFYNIKDGKVDYNIKGSGKYGYDNLEEFNKIFDKIKLMIDGIWINGYKVEFNLKGKYDGCNWGRENVCIIKIIWYKNGEKFGRLI